MQIPILVTIPAGIRQTDKQPNVGHEKSILIIVASLDLRGTRSTSIDRVKIRADQVMVLFEAMPITPRSLLPLLLHYLQGGFTGGKGDADPGSLH